MFVDAAITEEEQEQEQATAMKSRLRRNLLVHSKQASDQASNKSVGATAAVAQPQARSRRMALQQQKEKSFIDQKKS